MIFPLRRGGYRLRACYAGIVSTSRRPPSPAQLAANRANARKSTGPRTAEGKAHSAQNARKHGFTASTFAVVRLEELGAIACLREDLIACYQPANSQELFAIERIAIAQHVLLRAARLESGVFTVCMNNALNPPATRFTSCTPT